MSPFRRSRRAVEMCIAQRLLILSCLSRVAWAPAAVKGFLHGWSSGGTETGRDAVTGAGFLAQRARESDPPSQRPALFRCRPRTTRGENPSPPQAPRLLGKGSSGSVTAEQCTFPPRDDYDEKGTFLTSFIRGHF